MAFSLCLCIHKSASDRFSEPLVECPSSSTTLIGTREGGTLPIWALLYGVSGSWAQWRGRSSAPVPTLWFYLMNGFFFLSLFKRREQVSPSLLLATWWEPTLGWKGSGSVPCSTLINMASRFTSPLSIWCWPDRTNQRQHFHFSSFQSEGLPHVAMPSQSQLAHFRIGGGQEIEHLIMTDALRSTTDWCS